MTTLTAFNHLPASDAGRILRPCLDVGRWVDVLVAGRPYRSTEALIDAGRDAADPLTPSEIDVALAHHPRIGEPPQGFSDEAGLARGEQSGLELGTDVTRRLAAGNAAYEQRFGRIFLIRAAGRSSAEILGELESRLGNDDDKEKTVVGDQLRQIALLRLAAAVTS